MAGNLANFTKAMNTGYSAAWDQQWEQAVQAYQTALQEFPDNPKTLSNLGLALLELHRYEESLQAYQQALQVAPDDPIATEKVARLSLRVGKPGEAATSAMRAAELYIRRQEVDKAIENWMLVTQVDPNNIPSRTYLAMVYDKLDRKKQAVAEYLAAASLLQQAGDIKKASEFITRAVQLNPSSSEARQSQSMLRNGQPLPKPLRSAGNMDTLRPEDTGREEPSLPSSTGLDPIAEASGKAFARLAGLVFNLSDEGQEISSLRSGSMSAIIQGATSTGENKRLPRSNALLHVSQAIEDHSSGQDENAIVELEKAVNSGLKDQAVFFTLGWLLSKTGKGEKALRHLQASVKNETYTLAARLLMGQIRQSQGQMPEAAIEYLEALRTADSLCVPADQSAELHQAYEPYLDALSKAKKSPELERISNNIQNLLLQPDWHTHLRQAREQLPDEPGGTPSHPLVEILVQVQNSQVINALTRVRELARQNHPRAAMEEAYTALKEAPFYLPLHSLMGDILNQQGFTQEAITKYNQVAAAYGVRGEASQAVSFLRRVVKTNPMDLAARTRLIEQLTTRGMSDEAIREYIDLGDIQYRLAELDQARSTYATALELVSQDTANRQWSIKLLHRMADLDMQRLDWQSALPLYERIRSLQPEDAETRKKVVLLQLRLGQSREAGGELDRYFSFLSQTGRSEGILPFLEELVKEEPAQISLHQVLAEHYQRAGRLQEAEAEVNVLERLRQASSEHKPVA